MNDGKTDSALAQRASIENEVLSLSSQAAGALVPRERWNTADFAAWLAFRKDVLKMLAANIRASDITMFGDNPHYGERTCKMILNAVGADLDYVRDNTGKPIIEIQRWQGTGGQEYVEFVVYAKVLAGGKERTVIGSRATNDDFFAKKSKRTCSQSGCGRELSTVYDTTGKHPNTCPTHGQQERWQVEYFTLPLTEVNIRDVRQAAITNAWNKACGALGLLPSLEDLEEAGFDISTLREVNFGQGGSTGGAGAKAPETAEAQKQRTEILKLLMAATNNDQAQGSILLKKITTFQGTNGLVEGKSAIVDLTVKQLPIVIRELEKIAKLGTYKGDLPATTAIEEKHTLDPTKGVSTTAKAPLSPPIPATTTTPPGDHPTSMAPPIPGFKKNADGSWETSDFIKELRHGVNASKKPFVKVSTASGTILYAHKDSKIGVAFADGKSYDTTLQAFLREEDAQHRPRHVGAKLVAICTTNSKGWNSIERLLRVGQFEWEPDGTPVIQRGGEVIDAPYEPTNDDIPF